MPSNLPAPLFATALTAALCTAVSAGAQPAPAAAPPSAETIAFAACIASKNPDSIAARQSANSQSSRYHEARRIASVLSIATLNCDAARRGGGSSASFMKANLLAEEIVAKASGPTVTPPRRTTALASCIVAKQPAAARKFIDAAEAGIAAANQSAGNEITSVIDGDLLVPLLSLPGCGDEVTKMASSLSSDEFYAEVLSQLPGPSPDAYAASPLTDVATRFTNLNATPQLQELSTCLWSRSRQHAVVMSDTYINRIADPDGEVKVRLNRGAFTPCGGEASLAYAVDNATDIARQLFLIRQNQLARCLVARNSDTVKAARASVEAEGARILPAATTPEQRRHAGAIAPLPAELVLLGQSCDIAATTIANRNVATRLSLMDEINHEMGKGAKAAAHMPASPAQP
jgi:hypothetical protein